MATNAECTNVYDHGTPLDDKKRRVKCKYCAKVVSGFYRLKCHLGGIRGDVVPCIDVPAFVKEGMRELCLGKKKGSLTKEVGALLHPELPLKRNFYNQTTGSTHHNEMDIAQGSGNTKRAKNSPSENTRPVSLYIPTYSQAAANGGSGSLLLQSHNCIGKFFYENDVDFSAIQSPSFRTMLSDTFGCGQGLLKIPTCKELNGFILQDVLRETQQFVDDIRNSWGITGCSILVDEWTDQEGKHLFNIIVDCPKGAIYLRTSDVSDIADDVNGLVSFFDEVFEEVGMSNVVQVVAYSASACMAAVGKLLMEKYKSFFWTVSASHCIGLMLEKIGLMSPIQGVLQKAKSLTKFVHSRPTVLQLLRKLTNGLDLVKPSKIGSVVPFLTLENIVLEEENLKKLFLSPEWKASNWASTSEGKQMAELVNDCSFWDNAMEALNATIPLVGVLQLITEGDKHQLGYVYDTIDQAKETIKEEFKGKKSQYQPIWEAIDTIWNTCLHSPLHAAGYFLNPIFFYSDDFYIDKEVASGLLCCLVRMVKEKSIQDLITLQIEQYRGGKGIFNHGSSIRERSSVSPANWWSKYGGEHPELQTFAIRILSQTCSGACKYNLKRSMAEKLVKKGRNRIEQQRMSDLAFVHYNLHLQNFRSGGTNDEIVADIDPMHEWIRDDSGDMVYPEGEPTWTAVYCGNTDTQAGEDVDEKTVSSSSNLSGDL